MRRRPFLPRVLRPGAVAGLTVAVALVLGACGRGVVTPPSTGPGPVPKATLVSTGHHRTTATTGAPSTTVATTTTTATTLAPTTTAPPTTAAPATTAPPPVSVDGGVTVVGDSVTIDAEPNLEQDIPGVNVQAVVGEQWYEGVAEIGNLRAAGQLGSVVVVALGTNGPIDEADLADMMQACQGVSRVVFVTNHVPDDWQDPNNAILRAAPLHYANAVVADWEALAAENPQWFYSDGTHMPIGGPGAAAFAALVASKI